MIRYIYTRLTLEKKNTHIKYYPRVVSADVVYEYPLTIPSAEIEILSNVNLVAPDYITEVRTGDIVKLEVSIKMNPLEKTVWQTLFNGFVVTIDSEYNLTDNVKLSCVGFLIESTYALLETNASWGSSFDARDVLIHMYNESPAIVTYSADYCHTGVTLPSYSIKAYETFAFEVLEELEKLSGYKYYIDVIPKYINGNFSQALLSWKPIPTTPQGVFKIIQGTPRFISASFEVSEEDLRAYCRVTGATADGATAPYHGEATSNETVSKFGKRSMIESYDWINSDALCGKVAEGLVLKNMAYGVAGQCKIILTPEAHLCEMVNVNVPSIDLNGAPVVDWNFNMYKIQHHLSNDGCYTVVDLDNIKKDPYDYFAMSAKKVAVCKKNQCTKKSS